MSLPIEAPRRRPILICLLVIALTATVITTVRSTSIGDRPVPSVLSVVPDEQKAASAAAAPAIVEPKSASGDGPDAKQVEETPVSPAKQATSENISEQEANARRGRSEAPSGATEKPAAGDKETKGTAIADDKKAKADQKSASGKQPANAAVSSASKQQQQLVGKSGAPANKKLPANLGTVTSTGSGGPAHYMSKHDAYSAIAEKHGALAQDAMRKADKRQQHHNLHQRFGGIQKAGGLSDMMSPFKGVTDSGLARTLGASVRSIIKGKYSVPAYVASAVLGAVALMAFYESPISPLPVPPLPEPPVGRFPPEMPNISPNLQVPFRMNQQNQGQSYQRSFQMQQPAGQQQPSGQQQQQVLFPGATAQQRQMSAPAGPVGQLAANLISSVGANRQTAQRKSGLDYPEPSTSRSFFGSASQQLATGSAANSKLSAPANSQQHKSNSILSFLGLGGSGGTGGDSSSASSAALAALDIQRASSMGGHQVAAGGGPISSASGSDQKGHTALSNSHLVNKMKSYFDRPLGHNIFPLEQYAPNQYDQYRRMSIVQALAKDTAFLSSFFSPSRRSSNATITANQLQQSISNVLAAATGGAAQANANANQQQAPASRMQVDSLFAYAPAHQQQPQAQQSIVNTKRASSGYGLMRAADRIGHALLETFTSGLLHRSSQAQADGLAARKSEEQQQQQQQQNALASATSLLSDFMSTYTAQQKQASGATAQQPAEQHQQSHNKQQAAPEAASKHNDSAQGRSADQSQVSAVQSDQQVSGQQAKSQAAAAATAASKPESSTSVQQQSSAAASSQPLVRKTRSIGLDYPMEPVHYQQQPSRASQINNLVDMVSDSYKQNKLLFSFVMNQVGLSHALPYVDQFFGTPNEPKDQQV